MNNPNILAELTNGKWAMTEEGLRSLLSIAQREYNVEDYSTFHQISEDEKSALVADLGERVEDSQYSYKKGNVGVLYIDGPIIPRGSWMSDVSGLTSISSLTKEYMAFENDESITDIVPVMDTPGGNVVGISEFSQLIRNGKKPVTAFVYGMAASAGYWIASAADTILSVNTGEVGSIGVVASYRFQKDDERFEEVEIVSSQSPLKRADPRNDEGRAVVQEVVDDLADVFIQTVADNRGISKETVQNTFGSGSMKVAAKAEASGMIDGITTLSELLEELNNGGGPQIQTRFGNRNNNLRNAEESMSESTPETLETTAEETPAAGATSAASEAPIAAAEAPGAQAQEEPTDPVASERARIQAIEALGNNVSSMSKAQRAAAHTVINNAKYDGAQTADTVAPLVLAAVNKAAGDLSANVQTDAIEAKELAEEIPTVDADEDGGEDNEVAARANGMSKGMRQ